MATVWAALLIGGGTFAQVPLSYEAEQELLATEIKAIFDGGNATCRRLLSCCRGSPATVDEQLWDHVKSFAHNYHVRELLDSTPRMLERHYTFYNLWDRMKKAGSMQVFAADCYFGVVTMLLNALPAIEFEDGLTVAQEIYITALEMLDRNNDTQGANWTIPREPLQLQFPLYLGLLPNNCAGSKLRIYVYETMSFSAGSIFCSAGQWGVEVLVHRYFSSSSCRTFDPEEADLFLVPDYRACHLHLAPTYMHKGLTRIEGDDYHSQIIRNHKDKYRRPEQAEEKFQELLKSLKYFDRKNGMDHIFIFSDQGFIVNFTHTFPSWRDHMAHSIFLTTEAFTPGCGPSCFSPWKDAVIPGHIDMERFQRIASYNQPSSNRSFLFNFHGRLPVNHDYYEKVSVRRALLQFEHLPDVSVGGFIEEYFEVMGSSHFCLVPEGTSSWTNHLYESFFAGCIPLILSDRYVLPFQDLIDWPSLSVRWPQDAVSLEMYVYVKDMVENHRELVESMKKRVDAHACWFNFYVFDGPCSPYKAILHDLEKRSANLPRYLHPSYWIPSPESTTQQSQSRPPQHHEEPEESSLIGLGGFADPENEEAEEAEAEEAKDHKVQGRPWIDKGVLVSYNFENGSCCGLGIVHRAYHVLEEYTVLLRDGSKEEVKTDRWNNRKPCKKKDENSEYHNIEFRYFKPDELTVLSAIRPNDLVQAHFAVKTKAENTELIKSRRTELAVVLNTTTTTIAVNFTSDHIVSILPRNFVVDLTNETLPARHTEL